MRKVVLTIEIETVHTIKELETSLQALVFGSLKNGYGEQRRTSIKREMPKRWGHDCLGTIKQVQANLIK